MALFLITFVAIAVVFVLMAIGVMFGRGALKGTCGGVNNGECLCTQKCEKKLRAEALAEHK
ncbi:DUF539 domain-containing protein [Candidatus Methylocalor cossyra]|uniref:(Na+)-NQR maturation NqrM n=1 Tax=Candidatus Methylocalor cossyra TaxID=3108543 RepID=A0ABM9NLW8_9GAMM